MLVVCPFVVQIEAKTRECLDRHAGGWVAVDVSRSITAYTELFEKLWSTREDFIVIEQDIVPTSKVLGELSRCPEWWCGFPYELGGGKHVGLGCTRFRSELMTELPDAVERTHRMFDQAHPPGHWCALDDRLTAVLTRSGASRHVHQGEVVRLCPNPTHGCA